MHKPLKVIRPSPNPQIHDLEFRLYTLFDPTLDSLDVSMTMVLHPTHSHVLMHTHMIIGNFLSLLNHIDIGVFFHLSVFH
jgi:hypothetical protein